MIPERNETRAHFINRMKERHLEVAEVHHRIGNKRSMWLSLLYWAMAEEVYGDHWRLVNKEVNK